MAVNVEKVTQFIQTYTSNTETAQVGGQMVDFSVTDVGRQLKLPVDGLLLEALPELSKKQHEEMFEGEFPETRRDYQLEKAKHHWKPWLKFVNDYLVFRPQKDTMTQQIVVAAMNTWNGRRVNWAQIVQQKTREEIQRCQEGGPPTWELFSAFYISVCCQESPQRAVVMGTSSSSNPTQSLSSNPGGSKELREENHRLRLQVHRYKALVQEKSKELAAKNESLLACQSTMVKHVFDLAVSLKEKLDQQVVLDEHKKAIDLYLIQVVEKEQEALLLKQQLDGNRRVQEQLRMCQAEVKHAMDENGKLKEKVRLQEAELAQHKATVSGISVEQPSLNSTMSNSTMEKKFLAPRELFMELWSWESRGPTPKDLFQMFERQCQFFLLLTGLKRSAWINHEQFLKLWQQSVEWGVENLLVEILARRQLNLLDACPALVVIGDFGARILLYYASLENQWLLRSKFPVNAERREVSGMEYVVQICSQVYNQRINNLQQWQETLQVLLAQFRHPNFMTDVVSANIQRLSLCPSTDFSASHYSFQFDKVVYRLENLLREIAVQKQPALNIHGQLQFNLPPPGYVPTLHFVDLPVVGSPLTLKYLGQYNHMFDTPEEEPIPTWSAITWLLEDYGLSRIETVPADIHYKRISAQWSINPPAAVANHPQFCSCARRYKWNPEATLSSVEYNWPLIEGPKSTAAECQSTYRKFFDTHIHHLDPVCYRAAVFSNVLADWCGKWNVMIDVNQFSESHHEFLLLLKLQYRPTRWVRMVEAMAITHFLAGAHKCLINEFPNTRAGPFERFLRWQRLNAPELVEKDDDLRRAVEKMEMRGNKRVAEVVAQAYRPPPMQFRR